MGIVKSKDKSGMWKHSDTGFIIWDLLNKKDLHTGERARIYLGRMWQDKDLRWYWESAWGASQGQARDDLDALEMIRLIASEHFGTTYKIKEVRSD